MNAAKSLEKVQVASAIYDYIAAGIFAFPIIAQWYLNNIMHETHALLGSVGHYPKFEEPFYLLFVNLFGGFVIMWSTLRISLRLPVFGLCDGLLRVYFGCLMLSSTLLWSSSVMLYVFVFFEFGWGLSQLFLYVAQRKKDKQVLRVGYS